jgi:hypothetical protein
MLNIGKRVRVIYPDYVAGLRGELVAQEDSDRWIVKLEKNIGDRRETLLLSLKTSDFELLDSHSP